LDRLLQLFRTPYSSTLTTVSIKYQLLDAEAQRMPTGHVQLSLSTGCMDKTQQESY
jgi:hypothetical protein